MAHEHNFATPGPAGLGALAVACFGFGAVFLGKVDVSGLPLLAAWLVGGGIVQYTTAVIELKDFNITGGNVFLFFSAFFMFAAALSVFAKWYMINFMFVPKAQKEALDAAMAAAGVTDPKLLSPEVMAKVKADVGKAVGAMMQKAVHVEGWNWMAGAAFLTVVTPAYLRSPLFMLVILIDIVLWLIVGVDTGWYGDPKTLKPIIGWLLIISGWYGVYMSGAVVVNTIYGKKIYPTPPPVIKA
ncbi:MAG: GPR1/FUN34/YaaH family transporter [Syntrophales bacterium]|nr:GPR1/FUN34/YaaH family transporter [Syntrophales bacterium]